MHELLNKADPASPEEEAIKQLSLDNAEQMNIIMQSATQFGAGIAYAIVTGNNDHDLDPNGLFTSLMDRLTNNI